MDVFLSYSRTDKAAVDLIVAELDRAQVTYWLDRRDIPISVPWFDEVYDGVAAAHLVVFCTSPAWERSEACQDERLAAEWFHKPTVRIDVTGRIQRPAAAVLAAVGGVTDDDRAHAEVLRRAAAWDRAGRPARTLVRGRLLSRLAAVDRPDGRPLTPQAHEFLRRSSVAARRRRRWTIAGAAVVIIALLAGWIAPEVRERGAENLQATADEFSEFVEIGETTARNPYAGLRAASDLVRGGSTEAFGLRLLNDALDVPVPDTSTVLPGAPLSGFGGEDPTDAPSVVDTTGAARDVAGRPSTATPRGALPTLRLTTSRSVVEVRSVASGDLLRRIPFPATVGRAVLSPDELTVAAAVDDTIVLADVGSGRTKTTLRGIDGIVGDLRWTPDGGRIWGISGEHRVSRWTWHTGQRLVDDRTAWFIGLSRPSPDGAVLAVTRTGEIRRIEPSSGRTEVVARTGLDRVLSAGFDRTLDRVLLGSVDGGLLQYDLRTGSGTRLDAGTSCVPATSTYLPDGTAVVVACLQGPVRLVAANGLRELAVPYGGAGAVTVASDGTIIVAAVNGMVYSSTPDLAGLEIIGSNDELNPTYWRTVTVADDGQTVLLTGNGTGTIGHMFVGHRAGDDWTWYTIDLPTGDARQSRAAALSPDGQIAAVGTSDGGVHYFSTGDGNPGVNRSEVSGPVMGVVFRGERVIAATRDGVIDEIDGCPACRSTTALVGLADERLAVARRLGLVPD